MKTLPDGALAFAVSLASAPLVLWVLRRVRMLDLPTARSLHQAATPRSGGVAPALGCGLAAALASEFSGDGRAALLVVSVSLGLIGLDDDRHARPAVLRLLGQTVVASVALIWLLPGVDGRVLVVLATAGAMVAWLVGYINVFNFMDGINGLAATQAVVAGGYWWLLGRREHVAPLAAAGLIVAAAAAAFLPFNAPRARMFLGDVGSYFLGGWLAVAALLGVRAGLAPEAVIAPLALFVADAGVTLIRRAEHRKPILQPHREHTYQKLVAAGWSHGRTTLTMGLIMVAISACGTLSLTGSPGLRIIGDGAAVVLLSGYLVLPDRLSTTTLSGSGAPLTS